MATNAKVPKLDNESEAKLSDNIQTLDDLQAQIDDLNQQASDEILKVEQKYNKLRQPHLQKRAELIKQIDGFWLSAMLNHNQLSSLIDEDEVDALQYLTQVDVQEFEDIKSGFKISFHFASDKNPYFQNEVLTKTFRINQSGDTSCESTPIAWKDGKNLLKKDSVNAGGDTSDSNARKRAHGADELSESFFGWYKDATGSFAGEIAEIIKDEIWANPLHYYLNTSGDSEEFDDANDSEDLDEDEYNEDDDGNEDAEGDAENADDASKE
jgi:hypothetical protein